MWRSLRGEGSSAGALLSGSILPVRRLGLADTLRVSGKDVRGGPREGGTRGRRAPGAGSGRAGRASSHPLTAASVRHPSARMLDPPGGGDAREEAEPAKVLSAQT